jgi:hypothetical protein
MNIQPVFGNGGDGWCYEKLSKYSCVVWKGGVGYVCDRCEEFRKRDQRLPGSILICDNVDYVSFFVYPPDIPDN